MLGQFVLRESFLFAEMVKPRSIRIPTGLGVSAHARGDTKCARTFSLLFTNALVINSQVAASLRGADDVQPTPRAQPQWEKYMRTSPDGFAGANASSKRKLHRWFCTLGSGGVPANYLILVVLASDLALDVPADSLYIPAEGRVSEVSTETGHRSVFSGWNLGSWGLMTIDPSSGDPFIADQDDRAIYRINKNTGFPTMISGPGIGSGPALSGRLFGIEVEKTGTLVVADGQGGLLSILRIDPATGLRSVVSAGKNAPVPRGNGPNFESPFGIALERTGNLLVTDTSLRSIIRINPLTGDRVTISGDWTGDNVGSGPDFCNPHGLRIDGSDFVWVVDEAFEGYGCVLGRDSFGLPEEGAKLVRVNLSTGARTSVPEIRSSWSNRLGPFLNDTRIHGFDVDSSGRIIYASPSTLTGGTGPLDAPGAPADVRSWNPANKETRLIIPYDPCPLGYLEGYCGSRGVNPLHGPLDTKVEPDGHILVCDIGVRALFRITQTSTNSEITMLPNSRTGDGPDTTTPVGIAAGPSGKLFLVDQGAPAVFAIDPITRARTVISAGSNAGIQKGTGPNLFKPNGMALESNGMLLVADSGLVNPNARLGQKLLRIDPATGNRTILSSPSYGDGPALIAPFGVAVAGDGIIFVTDTDTHALFSVSPLTGNRVFLSGGGIGSGPDFSSPAGVAVLTDGKIALTDQTLQAIVIVDRSTGNRVILSSPTIGTGPSFESPGGIVESSEGSLFVIERSTGSLFKVDRTTGNRMVVSSSSVGSGSLVQRSPQFLAISPSPRLTLPNRISNGVQFNLLSAPGRQCRIEVTSDLAAWLQLTNFTTAITNRVLDADASSHSARFYRARFQ